jgi:soluble lytic murein transglycosylase-like protein
MLIIWAQSHFWALKMRFILFAVITGFLMFHPGLAAADLYRFTDKDGNTFYTNTPGDGRVKVALLRQEDRSKPGSPSPGRDRKGNFDPIISSASRDYSVDPDLVRAVIQAESNFNPQAVSPKGAMGLMQLMPGTAREMAVADPFDPKENIHGGVRYLSELLRLLNNKLPLALAAYNAGPAKVLAKNEIPEIEETRDYVQKVLRNYKSLKYQKMMTR